MPNKNRNIRRSGEEGITKVLFALRFIYIFFLSYLIETEAAMIREQIGIIERDIRSHNQLTYSLKCRATPFLQEYKEMQSRISMALFPSFLLLHNNIYFLTIFFFFFRIHRGTNYLIDVMIGSYIESDPDFVADLLSISDRMDEVLNAYQALEKKEKQAINNNNISVYEDSSEGNYVPLNSSKPELKKGNEFFSIHDFILT